MSIPVSCERNWSLQIGNGDLRMDRFQWLHTSGLYQIYKTTQWKGISWRPNSLPEDRQLLTAWWMPDNVTDDLKHVPRKAMLHSFRIMLYRQAGSKHHNCHYSHSETRGAASQGWVRRRDGAVNYYSNCADRLQQQDDRFIRSSDSFRCGKITKSISICFLEGWEKVDHLKQLT